ncbi:hypothetical protein RHSIM_Rhsim02G0250500 [Rhododendron simsii]|uniref:Translation elongation factor EF1B beta/delta subunit guanine nucleotide exchange domain-containing protein n=1 Tax=Rhododendron simsii TaxID=118357 RepID=A0A834LY78_RHOSS|nr:hypothetical protein RHSIM_Rhsim02G0250500 [Rhododendron simsii]
MSTKPLVQASAAEDDDDDDDVDLFGEETEEEKKAAEERAAAMKASGKKKESGKSSVLMDVKPWDDETDMKKLEEAVRSVQMEGLFWGASKLVPVGYGIKKLQIMLTIVDDLVSVDTLIEDHLTAEPINEYVQSCDIVAFNKICFAAKFMPYPEISYFHLSLYIYSTLPFGFWVFCSGIEFEMVALLQMTIYASVVFLMWNQTGECGSVLLV